MPTIHTHQDVAGRSPHNLGVSTFSDELVLARKGKAFAVSFKDRSAITLAGHSGKAFWFDKTNGGFVSSTFYYSAYPEWVNAWNKHYQPKPFSWTLQKPKDDYQNADNPINAYPKNSFSQSFPHEVTAAPSQDYFKFLGRTPKADSLTADFAEQLLINEKLGRQAKHTDYLAISFSSVDGVGHYFGPNSLEAEDNLLRLDMTIAHLLQVIQQEVGLEKTLIIVTADHGVSDSPSYLKKHHISTIKPLNVAATTSIIEQHLQQQHHLPKTALMAIVPPFVYLDHQIIQAHQLSVSRVSQSIANRLNEQPGIFQAYPLPIKNEEKDWLVNKVARMAYPQRAGDVYMVAPPYQRIAPEAGEYVNHDSPWNYNSYVPLLFVYPQLPIKTVTRPVYTTDIAPSLSALLGIKAPSAAVGTPLRELVIQ